MENKKRLFAGIDVGSLTAEAVILDEEGALRAGKIIRVRPRATDSAAEVFEAALAELELEPGQIAFCVSTGYGRESIPFASRNLSEVSCHGRGAQNLLPRVRTVIDVGGQDCKVIRVDDDGNLVDFAMNDKCAAGAGRFLEMMAGTLGLAVSELGSLALGSKKPLTLSSQCTIFAEAEVMQLLFGGKKRRDIAAGIHAALVRRIKALVGRVGLAPEICMTGGVSKNPGMVALLEKELGVKFLPLPQDPQLAGALGAALFARDAWWVESRRGA